MTKLNINYDEAQHEPRIVNSEVQSEESWDLQRGRERWVI
jgi:hypothetical protein